MQAMTLPNTLSVAPTMFTFVLTTISLTSPLPLRYADLVYGRARAVPQGNYTIPPPEGSLGYTISQ